MTTDLTTTDKIEWINVGDRGAVSKEWYDCATKLFDEALKAIGDAIQKQIEEQEYNDK